VLGRLWCQLRKAESHVGCRSQTRRKSDEVRRCLLTGSAGITSQTRSRPTLRDAAEFYDLHASTHTTTTVTMSGRLVTARLATLARRTALHTPRRYTTHSLPAGGLLRNEAGLRLIKRRPWPLGSYALHNLPATRSISFARVVPKLVTKLATAGAAAGGAVIAGVSYIQYQAGRTSTYTAKSDHY
jgi:hypothetical protein